MRAASIPARPRLGPFRSKRLLALAGDERLVEAMRRGQRGGLRGRVRAPRAGILGFCRHMLGSAEEAEDAVQHTFAAAFRSLQRDGERELALKPWLYAIARNRCLSVLRSRREQSAGHRASRPPALLSRSSGAPSCVSCSVTWRELPEEQRAALLLAELGDLSHARGGRRARLRGAQGEGARVPCAERADPAPRGARYALRRDPRATREPARADRCAGTSCATTCAPARAAGPTASR